ncbi:DUF4328 domain-containing protein [Streptomyces sp. SP17BM10]|uniref:DUF4328 domain-containing protein n=1 Tax=Streptomyces sp. SP17BM10 TaxID=3002530 RepID=UPI002E79C361|nr:DUF4328 domain-containing protein [Streptomyces sp. SP17BM10]MEE1788338.1 DUF4328 domain-containing protein [Streptomyces sp. SP17BM10]
MCGARPAAIPNRRCLSCGEADPAWPRAYRSPVVAAILTHVALAFNILLAVLAIGADITALVFYSLAHEPGSDIELTDFDTLEGVAKGLEGATFPLLALGAAAFITWFHLVRRNAGLFLPLGHRRGTGWTIGAWITPIVQLWFPQQLMADSWDASAPVGPDGRRRPVGRGLVSAWWAAWLCSLLLTRIATDLGSWPGGPVDPRATLGADIGAGTVRIAAAVLLILVVRRLTAMQEERRAMVNPHAAAADASESAFGIGPVEEVVAPADGARPADVGGGH